MGLVNVLRANRSLAVGVASGFVSLAGTLLTAFAFVWGNKPSWFGIVLVAITVAGTIPFLVAVFLGPKHRTGGRYLSDAKAAELIELAVHPKLSPLCSHLAVQHAQGAALMALAAENSHHAIDRVYSILDTITGELRREHKFTEQALVTHIHNAERLRHRLSGVWKSLTAKECFTLADGGRAKDLLHMAEETVRTDVVSKLVALLRGSPKDALWDREHPAYSQTIRKALKETIPDTLDGLRGTMGVFVAAARTLRSMIAALEKDWHLDLADIWKDDRCKSN